MNKCTFTEGRLTTDPKLSSTIQGDVNVRFVIAVDRRHGKKQKDAAREANRPTADFIPCVAWKGAATAIGNYCKKGDALNVSGAIRTSTYEKDGKRHYGWELEVYEFEFAGRRRNGYDQKAGNGATENTPDNTPDDSSSDEAPSIFAADKAPEFEIPDEKLFGE